MTVTGMLDIAPARKTRRKSRAAWLIVTGVLAALVGGSVAIAQNLPPCINEDGSGQSVCVWNASERGNGLGDDFVVVGDQIVHLSK